MACSFFVNASLFYSKMSFISFLLKTSIFYCFLSRSIYLSDREPKRWNGIDMSAWALILIWHFTFTAWSLQWPYRRICTKTIFSVSRLLSMIWITTSHKTGWPAISTQLWFWIWFSAILNQAIVFHRYYYFFHRMPMLLL